MTIPFASYDWSAVERVEHAGEAGTSFWRTLQFEGLRIRMVEYSAGYKADHWCRRGHIVYCVAGSFTSELAEQHAVILTKGMMYVVSDEMSEHRSTSKEGATLLIIDGAFLQ